MARTRTLLFILSIAVTFTQCYEVPLINLFWDSVFKSDISTRSISPKCLKSLQNAKADQLESFRYIDSSGNVPIGLLAKNTISFGHYDQCLEIPGSKYCNLKYKVLDKSENDSQIFAKIVKPLGQDIEGLDNRFVIGVCLPETCSPYDIVEIITRSQSLQILSLDLESQIFCDTINESWFGLDETKYGLMQHISLTYLISIVLISSIATLIGSWRISNVFSISRNLRKITKSLEHDESRNFQMDVFKLSLMSMIIALHIVAGLTDPRNVIRTSSNYKQGLDWLVSIQFIWLQPFNNALLMTTSFNISGYSSYLLVKKAIISGENQFRAKLIVAFKLIAYKWFKSVPLMMTVIAIQVGLIPLLGSGPMFTDATQDIVRRCQNNWWKHFLLLHNEDGLEGCMWITWNLSTEFQLFLIAIAVCFISLMFGKRMQSICIFCLIFQATIRLMVVTYQTEGNPALIFDFEKIFEYLQNQYFPVYAQMTPYFIGFLYGSLELQTRHSKLTRIVTIPILIILFCSSIAWNTFGIQISAMKSALFCGLSPLIWSISLFALISTLKNNQSGSTTSTKHPQERNNNDLGKSRQTLDAWRKILKIVSKFHFSIYLIQPIFTQLYWFTARFPIDMSNVTVQLARGFFSTMMCYLMGFVLYIFFEAPYEKIRETLILKENKQKNE